MGIWCTTLALRRKKNTKFWYTKLAEAWQARRPSYIKKKRLKEPQAAGRDKTETKEKN
jgi:hypothetical protein